MNNKTMTYARIYTKQQITASTTSAKITNALGAATYLVYIFNNSASVAYVLPGQTGGASSAATGFPIAAGSGHYLGVSPGEFIHAILATGTGTIDVCEMGA